MLGGFAEPATVLCVAGRHALAQGAAFAQGTFQLTRRDLKPSSLPSGWRQVEVGEINGLGALVKVVGLGAEAVQPGAGLAPAEVEGGGGLAQPLALGSQLGAAPEEAGLRRPHRRRALAHLPQGDLRDGRMWIPWLHGKYGVDATSAALGTLASSSKAMRWELTL